MAQVPIQQAIQIALEHHRNGRLAEAQSIYRQIVSQQPDNSDAIHLLGVIAHQFGEDQIAIDLIRRAIAIVPTDAAYHSNLGEAYRASGQLELAIAAYSKAVELNPHLIEPRNNLAIVLNRRGGVLRNEGKPEEATLAFNSAIRLKSDSHESYNNLGNALHDLGRLDDAVAAYRRAIQLMPDYAAAYSNLGNALREQKRLSDAVAACRAALALDPGLAEAHYNLGNALRDQRHFDKAVIAYSKTIQLQADNAHAHNNLGNVLRELGQLDDALACFDRAIALQPDVPSFQSNRLFLLQFHPGFDGPAILAEHRRWNSRHRQTIQSAPRSYHNDRSPGRRLRIGYVSPNFREHCQSHFTLPLLSHHNPEDFEVFCYADVVAPDGVTETLRGYASTWRDVVGMKHQYIAEMIRTDQIDILIDLTLHMAHNPLMVFAHKPAPIQLTWLGYPGTTGLETIDYRLSDPWLDPADFDNHYSEKTLRLPDTFWCYDPLTDEPLVNDLPAFETGHVTFGCLNHFSKVNDVTLRRWATLLKATANSHLLLMTPHGSARERVLGLFHSETIDGSRIKFCDFQPRNEYLRLYNQVDIGLDTLPYNGHTTSLDSLWMGVPVVTLAGETVAGRAGLSQLSNLGLTELVARTPREYVQIATELAGDLPRLALLRRALRRKMQESALMDASRFTRHIEAVYRQIWINWCGNPG